MTRDERFNVGEHIRGSREIYSGCVYFFIQLVGGAVLGMLASVIPGTILQWLGAPISIAQAVVVVGTISGFLLGVRSVLKDRWEHVRPYQIALAENTIEEVHCTVLDAVRVSLGEDQGDSFFLDVGDSKLLYLEEWRFFNELDGADEDELDEPDAEVRLPRRELHLTRTPRGGPILTRDWQGEPFEPSREREPLDGQTEYLPKDGEIVTGSLATLEADLRRLRQR
jgi:hypothetical protein